MLREFVRIQIMQQTLPTSCAVASAQLRCLAPKHAIVTPMKTMPNGFAPADKHVVSNQSLAAPACQGSNVYYLWFKKRHKEYRAHI